MFACIFQKVHASSKEAEERKLKNTVSMKIVPRP